MKSEGKCFILQRNRELSPQMGLIRKFYTSLRFPYVFQPKN
jgi:hypothetical protein